MLTTLGLVAVLTVAAQDTDTTFAADGATRLDIEGPAGEVVVRGWDRDEIRVQADHSRRTELEIYHRRGTIQIEAEGAGWSWNAIADMEITVPRGIEVSIDGMNTDVDIQDVGGAVDVSTLQGNVIVAGGRNDVTVETVNGRVRISDVDGDTEVSSAAGIIEIDGAEGEVVVEAVGGEVVLLNMRAHSVEVSSVGGRIEYQGLVAANGDYYFGSHGGPVVLELDPDVQADFRVVSAMGRIRTDYPGVPQPSRKGRLSFTLGDGSAEVEVETWGGTITIRERSGR